MGPFTSHIKALYNICNQKKEKMESLEGERGSEQRRAACFGHVEPWTIIVYLKATIMISKMWILVPKKWEPDTVAYEVWLFFFSCHWHWREGTLRLEIYLHALHVDNQLCCECSVLLETSTRGLTFPQCQRPIKQMWVTPFVKTVVQYIDAADCLHCTFVCMFILVHVCNWHTKRMHAYVNMQLTASISLYIPK